MSSSFSEAELRHEVDHELEVLAREHPQIRVSATGIAQRIHAKPERVSHVLLEDAKSGLLRPIVIERCENGHQTGNILDDDTVEAEADCPICGHECIVRKFVVYEFSKSLTNLAERHNYPKAVRRRAPLKKLLQRLQRLFRR